MEPTDQTIKVTPDLNQLEDQLAEVGKQLQATEKVKPLCDALETFQEGLFANQFRGWLVLQAVVEDHRTEAVFWHNARVWSWDPLRKRSIGKMEQH